MSPANYSFLDLIVLDMVRTRFAAGDAMVILSVDLEHVLWANGPGAVLFGHQTIDAAIGAEAGLPPIARRQIAATSGFPDIGENRPLLVRLTAGLSGETAALLASSISLPDGERAILLVAPVMADDDKTSMTPDPHALGGFDTDAQFLAFIDGQGKVEAASAGFAGLGIAAPVLAGLVAEVAGEDNRLVKRLLRIGAKTFPAGIARLSDDPERHLLVVVDEGDAATDVATDVVTDGATEAVADGTTAAPVAPVQRSEKTNTRPGHWYLTDDIQPVTKVKDQAPAAAPVKAASIRFVWRTDAQGRFLSLSDEFAAALGGPSGDVIGRRFRDVAKAFGFDPSGEVGDLLERQDTWSGRSVLWPMAGTSLRVPVDLAALPVYNRAREFEGFRGFGVIRMAEAGPDPERIGLALVPNASSASAAEPVLEGGGADPFKGEAPALALSPHPVRRISDKIIRLVEEPAIARQKTPLAPPIPEQPEKSVPEQPVKNGGLSSAERHAFREIARRLRKDNAASADVTEDIADTGSKWPEEEKILKDDDSIAFADFQDARAEDHYPDAALEKTEAAASDSPLADAGKIEAGAPDTSILERLPVPLLVHSGDVLHYANEEFFALTGYATLAELIAAGGLGALFTDPYEDPLDASKTGPDEARHALFLHRKDGGELPVEAILRSVQWQHRTALLLVLRRCEEKAAPGGVEAVLPPANLAAQVDIAELKARISEMRTIIDTATDGVVLIGCDGRIDSLSRPAEALFGFDNDEVIGKPFASLFAIESQRVAQEYLAGLSEPGVASVLNDGREVIGREAQGRFIPLFMTIGRLPGGSGFCAVVRDITQWKRTEEDLTQARALAERTSSQKSDFLARISHEIRTPLNAIIGFSELMMDEKFGPVANDRYRDYLRDINRSGNHVLDLVNDLLDISKIEAGQQEMDYEAVSLNDTLAETVTLMQPQANRERVIIRSSFASQLPEVVADLRSVRQIALNILSNAVRYTQAGGQVIVSTAYETSGDVVMRVRDTGIGMTQAEIEQALKPFRQLNTLKRGRGDGTGLGLPLTKAMVEANRAHFTITSTPGEGTLVEVAFPSVRVLAG
ncbi:PAS domain S-box protein [Aquamicrobium segne]|uniref:histidine kinase n=1 Tax=Aquamicrobium segne TaxID=469547 RepID=A0ABW0GZP9_9HYPH